MAKTINVNMNYPEITEDHKHVYNCKGATNIDVIYDSEIDDCFDNVSYSGSTVSINVCGLEKFIFTNIKDTSKVNFKVTRSEGALQPGQVQFNGTVGDFLNAFDVPPIDDRGSTINIDMNYGMTANVMNYNCKNVDTINVTFDSEIEDMYVIHKSGSTVSLNVTDAYKYNFNNISSLEDVKFKVTRSAGSVIAPGEVQFDSTLKELCDAFETWLPEKGTKVDGSVFDDNIAFAGYEGTKGLTINANKGDDVIDGTEFNDTITGGEGVNTINLYTQKAFGDDVVVLTKGEQLTLKVVDQDAEDAHWNYTYSHIVGNDLVVDVYDGEIIWENDEYGNDYPSNLDQINKTGSVTIKNYTKKDVMTNDGALLITDNNVNSTPENLRTGIYNVVIMDKDHFNKASYTGTWMNDEVHADKFKVYKKGKEITTDTEGFEKVKGATINLADAPFGGMNYAEGSIYADTLKGGNGKDMFEGGMGNDVMTGGKGSNSVIHNYGDGADIYNMTKDETLGIRFNGVSESEIQFEYANNNKDLKVFYEDDGGHEAGSVTIKNFASKNITNGAVVYGDELNGIDLTTDDVAVATIVDPDYKGSTVKGTWMNDMINASGYTNAKGKGLTLNGGNGDNYVIGSNYGDTLVGGVGSDWLQGGQGNDKLTGGAESDVFIFDPQVNNGVDTITDATADDVISIANTLVPFSEDQLRYLKNGNNLEIYYDNTYNQENKIIVQKHFNKDGTRVATSLMTNDPELTNLADVYYGITGSGKINGTEDDDIIIGSVKADTIKALGGDDEIKAGDGNDNVYGGKGDDIINAGAGKNNIYYSLDDGDDTIFAGGGTDTLVFDKGIAVTAEESGSDVIITYSGTKKGVEYSNTITIDNYATTSVGYAKVNGKTVTIDDLLNGGGGTTKNYEVNDTHLYDDPDHPLTLSKGYNNKVVFSGTYDDCYITSNNTSANTDTLQISNFDMTDSYSLGNFQYNYYDATLNIDTTPNGGEGGGLIMYTATNTPKIAIADSERNYNFNGYTSVQGTEQNPLALADGNNLLYIKATEGTSYVTSNDDYNVIKTGGLNLEHGAGLDYTYGGGYDVIATASSSNDVYNVAIGSNTSAVVYDADGADTINVTGDNIRMVYDSGTSTVFKTQCIFMDKDVLSDMTTEEFKNVLSTNKGLNIAAMNINDADTINVNGTEVTMDNWSIETHNVHQAVAAWLTDNAEYNSVSDALENCTDDALLASLKGCFVTGTYESPNYHIKKTDEGKTFNLAKGNNTVIFDDAPILSNYNDSGCITLNSANKAGDGNTDTIDISKKNQQDEGLSFVNNTVTVMDADGLGDRLWVDATVYSQCPGDGSFVYNDFYTNTAPNVVIKDMDRTYHASGYNTVQNLTLASDTKNRLVAIKAEEGTSSITSNGNYNAIYNVGDAKLNYTYGGGHDNVVSSGWNTDDTYNVALTANSSVNIIDWGGTDDTLTVTNTAVNKARVLFDVYKTITYGIPQYEANTGHFVMTDVSNLSVDVLATSTEMHPIQLTEGIHVSGGMENITISGEDIDLDVWCTGIAADVGAWLSANDYNSVYDAFYGENPCTDQTQINALVQCYNVAYGS